MEIFQYSFFINAALSILLIAVVSGVVGTYIVSRRMLFVTGGITHTSFGGLGLGMYLGINPTIMATIFSLMSALGIEWLSQKGKVREDSSIAVFWALGMALGIIFVYMAPGYNSGLSGFLFGNILTVTTSEIAVYALFALLVELLFLVYNKSIIYTAFDRDFAKIKGIKVQLVEYGAIAVVSICIVLSIKLIGIMLLLSFLSLPQMTAEIYSKRYNKTVLLSSIVALTGGLSGLFISTVINIPTGATIVIVLTFIYFLAKIVYCSKKETV